MWFWEFVRNINSKVPFPSCWIRNSGGRARKLCFNKLSKWWRTTVLNYKIKELFQRKRWMPDYWADTLQLNPWLHTWRTPKRKESEAYWVNEQGRPCFHFLIGYFLILHFNLPRSIFIVNVHLSISSKFYWVIMDEI